MQLQYVFGSNPKPKRLGKVKKSAARKKKVQHKKNSSKMVAGGHMARKKKASPAQRAWRKKFAAMYGKKRGKKKASRKNAVRKVRVRKELPEETVVVRGPTRKEVDAAKAALAALEARYQKAASEYDRLYQSPFARDFVLSRKKGEYSKETGALAKANRRVDKLEKELEAASQKFQALMARGGKVVKNNSSKRRRRRKSRNNPARPDYGMITVGNPKKKRKGKRKAAKRKPKKARRSRRRKSRKAKAFMIVASAKRRVPKKIGRKKWLRVKTTVRNPSMPDLLSKYGVVALGGAAYPWFNYGVNKAINAIDQYVTKGAIARAIGSVDAVAPGIAAPGLSLGAVLLVKFVDDKYGVLKKLGDDGAKYAEGALDTIGVLAAAEIGKVLAAKASLTPAGMGFSGVRFFPGMAGADFGQLGYHQSPGDFGNVKYFPAPMSGVETFPDGARGDEMYVPSMADQYREAEGLGIIPEGMGEIPEGMGEDPGQMG